jgi:thioredoxin 1
MSAIASETASKVIDITERNFHRDVLDAAQPVLVDFGASWCAPCRAIAPSVEAIAAAYDGRVRVGACDVDRNPDLANRCDIRSLPTLLLFRDGRVVGRIVGAVARDRIQRLVEEVLP